MKRFYSDHNIQEKRNFKSLNRLFSKVTLFRFIANLLCNPLCRHTTVRPHSRRVASSPCTDRTGPSWCCSCWPTLIARREWYLTLLLQLLLWSPSQHCCNHSNHLHNSYHHTRIHRMAISFVTMRPPAARTISTGSVWAPLAVVVAPHMHPHSPNPK
jgi:hypothetical protein